MKTEDVHIYIAGNRLTLDGIDNSHNGMFVLDCGGNWMSAIRTSVRGFAQYIVNELENKLNPKQEIDVLNISYDVSRPSILEQGDGYFGRPKIPYAVMKNREMTENQKRNLSNLINNIGKITLQGGKEIKLIA